MDPGCTCGATLKHSADCVVFWAPLPRQMQLEDIVPGWVWAYPGHVFLDGSVMQSGAPPSWCSNDWAWHGC
jgi:hypothetical protein